MSEASILVERAAGYHAITLNRPDRLNAFDEDMHRELMRALLDAEADPECRALLLTGAGRGFCAGQDLSKRMFEPGVVPDLSRTLDTFYNPLVRKLRDLAMPIVCAVNGVAAGAGANIALACDIVIAAKSAKFIQSFANIGLIPDSGGTWVLPRLVGQARALGLALTAEPLPAEKAAEWGLIWKAVEDEALDAEVDALAQRFASAPTRGLARIKRMIRESWEHSLGEELVLQRDAMRELGYSDDYREGVAAFMEKRAPRFTGK